jgi:hypothetical protein
VDARKTLMDLRWAIGGFSFQVMRGVCGLGIPLVALATEIKIDKNTVSVVLRQALWESVDFYGLEENPDAR